MTSRLALGLCLITTVSTVRYLLSQSHPSNPNPLGIKSKSCLQIRGVSHHPSNRLHFVRFSFLKGYATIYRHAILWRGSPPLHERWLVPTSTNMNFAVFGTLAHFSRIHISLSFLLGGPIGQGDSGPRQCHASPRRPFGWHLPGGGAILGLRILVHSQRQRDPISLVDRALVPIHGRGAKVRIRSSGPPTLPPSYLTLLHIPGFTRQWGLQDFPPRVVPKGLGHIQAREQTQVGTDKSTAKEVPK